MSINETIELEHLRSNVSYLREKLNEREIDLNEYRVAYRNERIRFNKVNKQRISFFVFDILLLLVIFYQII